MFQTPVPEEATRPIRYPSVPTVLLVGPGLDAASRAAARAVPPPVVVDGDAVRCALLRCELGPSVQVLQADVTALPFADGSFTDVVVGAAARLTLTALGELARVLAPGGRLTGRGYRIAVERHGIRSSVAHHATLAGLLIGRAS
jgi:hypothetical protein